MLGGGVVEAAVRLPLTQIPNALPAAASGPRSTTPVAMLKRKTLPGAVVWAQNDWPSGSSAIPNHVSSPGRS